MSFDVICPNCGATSNPSTGICPFCKSAFPSKGASATQQDPSLAMIKKTFDDGHLPEALGLITSLERERPKALEDLATVNLYLQILVECEGPLSKINSLLSTALLKFPNDPGLGEFLELSRAKTLINGQSSDAAAQSLVSILQRSPQNYLALFLLGSTLHWEKQDEINSVKYLEKCVSIRPHFLRAWACLGVAYRVLGNQPLANRAFQKCLALETDPKMKSQFQAQIT